MTEQKACALCGAGGHTAAQCNWNAPGALESIRLPKHGTTIALDEVLAGYLPDDREDVREVIEAYADIHARKAVMLFSGAGRASHHSVEANDMAQCVACEGKPAHGNDPCAVCGAEGGRGEREPLPYWEPCNPGCDSEFNGGRSRYCAQLCHNARAALAQPSPAFAKPSLLKDCDALYAANAASTAVNPGAPPPGCVSAQPSPAPDQSEQPLAMVELERPEVVALLSRDPDGEPRVTFCGAPDMHIKDGMGLVLLDQAESIVGPLSYKAELYDEVWALATSKGYMNVTTAIAKLEQERDDALERLAELEGQSGIEFVYDSDELVAVPRGLLGAACHAIDKKRYAPRTIAKLREYARGLPASIAQAGQVPEGWKLVPIEPTEQILDEFDSIVDYGAEDSKDAWRRLLAAAPAQGGE